MRVPSFEDIFLVQLSATGEMDALVVSVLAQPKMALSRRERSFPLTDANFKIRDKDEPVRLWVIHAFYFSEISWRQFECTLELQWPADA